MLKVASEIAATTGLQFAVADKKAFAEHIGSVSARVSPAAAFLARLTPLTQQFGLSGDVSSGVHAANGAKFSLGTEWT